MPSVVTPSGLHAVLAIDPGGTTGVAAGYVELKSTLKETLLGVERRKAIDLKGEWLGQADQLAKIIKRFVFGANVESQLPIDNIHVVMEDFVLRMPARTTNLTSVWVAAATAALVSVGGGLDIIWQQPSDAKRLATNDRLRLWGLWEIGSEHQRDAWRHFALAVNKLVP